MQTVHDTVGLVFFSTPFALNLHERFLYIQTEHELGFLLFGAQEAEKLKRKSVACFVGHPVAPRSLMCIWYYINSIIQIVCLCILYILSLQLHSQVMPQLVPTVDT